MKPSHPICVIAPFNTPFLYGMERAVLELFSALRPEVQVHLVSARSFKQRELPVVKEIECRGLEHSFLPDDGTWPGFGRPRSVAEGLKLAYATLISNLFILRAGWRCDMLYLPSPRYAGGLLTAIWMRLRGRRVVLHCHDLCPGRRILRFWSPWLTDLVHNTQLGREQFLARAPFLAGKHNVQLPNLMEAMPGSSQPPQLHGNHADVTRVMFVGQVSGHKGIDILISAFNIVAANYPNAELHIVGASAEGFRDQFDELLAKSPARSRIHAWGFRADALSFMRAADIYVQPSPPSRFQESFGRGVVEAMALGVPVVCFASGALREVVEDGVSGVVCEEGVGPLADALGQLLGSKAERERLGVGGRQRYASKFAPELLRPRWIQLFQGHDDVDVSEHNNLPAPASGLR